MTTYLMLTPTNDNGVPDLQIRIDETLAYASGTKTRQINDFIEQADETLPNGYDSILRSTPILDDADPPNITGYRIHALRTEVVPRMYGGYSMLAPARAGLPVALLRVHSTQAKLNVMNTRLRALTPTNLYGRVPLTANGATRDVIANKLDELAELLAARPGVAAALEGAATEVNAITLANWKSQFYDVLARLFQLPSRHTIDRISVGEPPQ